MIRKASIGPRNVPHRTEVVPPTTPERESHSKFFNNDGKSIKIARPHLVVVAGYLFGSDIVEVLRADGIKTRDVRVEWGNRVLEQLGKGKIDIAVYNKTATEQFLKENPNSQLHIIGDIGSSMGGKNFSITALKESSLTKCSIDEIPTSLSGRTIYVGVQTDRFTNLLTALRITETQLHKTGANIINISDPDLVLLENNPEALLVCGQNARVAAQKDDRFVEILNYDLVDDQTKGYFRSTSANVLVFSSRAYNLLKTEPSQLMQQLEMNLTLLKCNEKRKSDLIDMLADECFSDDDHSKYDCTELTEQILFETYHIGCRRW